MRAVRAVPTVTRAEPRRDPDDHRLGADAEMKQPLEAALSNGVRHDELESAQRAHLTMSLLQLLPKRVR
jgi:hypothetical protein